MVKHRRNLLTVKSQRPVSSYFGESTVNNNQDARDEPILAAEKAISIMNRNDNYNASQASDTPNALYTESKKYSLK